MTKKVYINGRFLTSPFSGVQRSAFELILALDKVLARKSLLLKEYSFIILYSGNIINPIELTNISIQKKGILKGNLWEQLELPLYTLRHLLINLCSIAPVIKRKQLVLIHDASFFVNKTYFSFAFRIWYKFAIPIIGLFSKHILTVSEFSKSELIKYAAINSNKISVIYNSADHIARFQKPSTEFVDKISKLRPYCLAVSNLGANKNFKGLNLALNLIDFKPYNMVIAGAAQRVLNATSTVEGKSVYLGYIDNNELSYLYSHATLFIFPSFYEGFGIPPLEAMISGCPVIASQTSSIPEICGFACAYFDPYQPVDMATKIEKLLNDPERLIELKTLGKIQASKYNWEESGKNLLSIVAKYA